MRLDRVRGDATGLAIPAHPEALRTGGEAWLTEAFRASGALAAGNSVTRITQVEECPGGSTGRKLLLSVDYSTPGPRRELFVKFSRDFDDMIRDRSRDQMESEVRIALLSRSPDFPIAVPACLFADYHSESGTGILITERIAFGTGAIEPHHAKCLDTEMPAPLEHYEALVAAVARLAAADKSGQVDASQFPPRAIERDVIRYDAARLLDRIARFADFAARYSQLLLANLRSMAFVARLHDEAPRFLAAQGTIRRFLRADPDFIALCHWNANVDNAWFWRGSGGDLRCGLIDWGRAGRMNVALALWGALSAAEPDLLDAHLEALLARFAAEYAAYGGPALDLMTLGQHFDLVVATMGLAWLMDGPALIAAQVPDLEAIESRFDPRLRGNEGARTQLHMLTSFLNLWQTRDFGAALGRFMHRETK